MSGGLKRAINEWEFKYLVHVLFGIVIYGITLSIV